MLADEITHVVFVGGPTLTPLLRCRIGDAFGGRIAEGIDPMTIVARGAALYAATAGLDARLCESVSKPSEGLAVRVEHPAVTCRCRAVCCRSLHSRPGRIAADEDPR